MMKLQEDNVLGNMEFSVDDIYNPEFQADAVSGINDSSYNAFPTSPAYNQGGFVEPIYKSTNPVYEQPVAVIQEPITEEPPYQGLPSYKSTNPVYEPQPVYVAQEPIREEPAPATKCMRVIFTANRGFSAQAYWKDCSGVQQSKFVSVNETLEVDALDGTASGLPFMSYPIGQSPEPIKSTNPVRDLPVEPVMRELPVEMPVMREVPIDPVFFLPVVEPTPVDGISQEIYSPAQPTPDVVAATPKPDVVFAPSDEQAVVDKVTPEVPPVAPATQTLPTKTSKDLKPYIIVGIAVVGILIASRLFAKK